MEDTLVVANVNEDFSDIYAYCTKKNSAKILEKAKFMNSAKVNGYAYDIKHDTEHTAFWQYRKATYENAKYEIMTRDEFERRQTRILTNSKIKEVTKETFDIMFRALPPLHWCTIDGVEMFCMSEMYNGCYTKQYAKAGDKYYTAIVDVCYQDTWIHKRLPYYLEFMKDNEEKIAKTQEAETMQKEIKETPHWRFGRKRR